MKDLKLKISKSLSIFFTILFVYLSIENLYLAIKNGGIINSVTVDVFLLFWAYKIFHQRRWALNLLVMALFLFAMSLLGIFSPFAAGDYNMVLGEEPPSVSSILLWLVPTELLLLTMIYFINPSKKKA